MPKVVDAARVTVTQNAVWRTCTTCGQLAALPPDVDVCPVCGPRDGRCCWVCNATDMPLVPAGRQPGWGPVAACPAHAGPPCGLTEPAGLVPVDRWPDESRCPQCGSREVAAYGARRGAVQGRTLRCLSCEVQTDWLHPVEATR
jgi:hypothetical protein